MRFADLKNDFMFRRIFGSRPEVLRRLLNDVLVREGEKEVVEVEYLPSEQVPLGPGPKVSILDVRCRERSGRIFVVEMQLIHVRGFLNRVVFNAARAYADQLRQGEAFTRLKDVIAVSICDFALWPERDKEGRWKVPLLSRWSLCEMASGQRDMDQIQYVFLELPKVEEVRPKVPGAGLWAWLFARGQTLEEVPDDLPEGVYREAVNLANEATMTLAEQEAYRRSAEEVRQAQDLLSRGWDKGFEKGELKGKTEALRTVLEARGLVLTEAEEARIAGCERGEVVARWLARAASAASVAEVLAE